MTTTIQCPACNRRLNVPEEMRGQPVKCPVCAHAFTAPDGTDDAPERAPPPPPWEPPEEPVPESPPLRYDDEDAEDDTPRMRRPRPRYDDDYDGPVRRRRPEKPGKVTAIAILTLVGGIVAIMFGLMWLVGCCLWPGAYYSLVMGILATVKGAQLLRQDDHLQPAPRTIAILQIINIINLDVTNCVAGILTLVFLNEPEVRNYYRG